jgi:hypothetical protein
LEWEEEEEEEEELLLLLPPGVEDSLRALRSAGRGKT